MPKYIRTKDNELYEYVRDFDEYIIATKNGIYSNSIKKDNILKQAEDIKDLCDMFVVIAKEYPMPIEMPLTYKKEFEKMKTVVLIGMSMEQDVQLKLAIWTDEGLIYVATMNKEGEFKLI